MRKLTISNLKKTIYYFNRNGLRDTYLAALERLQKTKGEGYVYQEPSPEQLEQQRNHPWKQPVKFSLLVPAYQTPEVLLRELIDSVLAQTYSHFELLIGDAGTDAVVKETVASYHDERIIYLPLKENGGISRNTNGILEVATGEYLGLLDHDDLLTVDALYEMALKLEEASAQGKFIQLLYSDEDKCNETGEYYYEPHRKTAFNSELLLSNNYICHFLVMEAGLLKELRLREEYDGAQDYDLVLRAVSKLWKNTRESIVHVPKVLYHWRCHRNSTAQNPQSKQYAYHAGGRALQDFMATMGWKGKVNSLPHLGFYRIEYEKAIWEERQDVGAVGGNLLDKKNKITGGIYDKSGNCPYLGLKAGYSGYMHRAALRQEAYAVDVRNVGLAPGLYGIFQEVTGQAYDNLDVSRLPQGEALWDMNQRFAKSIRREGYRVIWDPRYIQKAAKGKGSKG